MSNLAVIFQKDINAVAAGDAGRSEIVDLDGAKCFSCMSAYTVDTPVGASITYQGSNDGENWTDLESATSITVNGQNYFESQWTSFRYFSVLKAISSGTVDLTLSTIVIGDPI